MKQTCLKLSHVHAMCMRIALMLLMFIPLCALAQNVNVHGTVTDGATGEEVIGATVKVKGSTGGYMVSSHGC